MVHRLERRGVFELDRQLCGVAAAMMRRSYRAIRIIAAGAAWLLCASAAFAAKTQNVVLIVSDGLRWQEIFTGAEEDLLNDTTGGSWLPEEDLRKRYWRADRKKDVWGKRG